MNFQVQTTNHCFKVAIFDFKKLEKNIRDFLKISEEMKTIDIRQISKKAKIRRVRDQKTVTNACFAKINPNQTLEGIKLWSSKTFTSFNTCKSTMEIELGFLWNVKRHEVLNQVSIKIEVSIYACYNDPLFNMSKCTT